MELVSFNDNASAIPSFWVVAGLILDSHSVTHLMRGQCFKFACSIGFVEEYGHVVGLFLSDLSMNTLIDCSHVSGHVTM